MHVNKFTYVMRVFSDRLNGRDTCELFKNPMFGKPSFTIWVGFGLNLHI